MRWDVLFGSATVTLIVLIVTLKGDKIMFAIAGVFAAAALIAFFVHRHRGAR